MLFIYFVGGILLMRIRGFSIAEVMVAAGLMGLLSVGLLNITKQQAVVQKRSETSVEINIISSLISQTLLNSGACNNTLGLGGNVSNGKTLTAIKNRNGEVLFDTTSKYGNNTVGLQSMELSGLSVSPTTNGFLYGTVKLDILFEKLSKTLSGKKTLRKSFTVNVQLDGSSNLTKCYSATENAVDTAVGESQETICASIGGNYDTNIDKCELGAFQSLSTIGAKANAASTSYLQNYVTTSLNTYVINKYAPLVSGGVDLTGDVKTVTKFCVGSKCRDFSASACTVGQVAKGIGASGTVNCQAISCIAGKYFRGVDTSGNAICTNLPACTGNNFLHSVDAAGNAVCRSVPNCTNANEYLTGVDVSGNPICKAMPLCTNKTYLAGIDSAGRAICGVLPTDSCPANQYISEIKPDGTITCKKVSAGSVLSLGSNSEYLRGDITWNPLNKAAVGLSSVSNVAQIPDTSMDGDGTLSANSNNLIPTQLAVKSYVDNSITSSVLGGGGGVWTTSGSNVYRSGGRVGIGTATPDSTLQVSGGSLHVSGGGEIFISDGTGLEGGQINLFDNTGIGRWHIDSYGGNGSEVLRFFRTDESVVIGMVISRSGNVGIGTQSPSSKLQVNGTVSGTSAFVNSSDKRYKKNFVLMREERGPILDLIDKLEAQFFDWRHKEFPDKMFKKRRGFGFIAQEVEKVFPEVVTEDKKGFKSIAYAKLVAPLVEGVKELYAYLKGLLKESEENREMIKSLKDEVDKLKDKIDKLNCVATAEN